LEPDQHFPAFLLENLVGGLRHFAMHIKKRNPAIDAVRSRPVGRVKFMPASLDGLQTNREIRAHRFLVFRESRRALSEFLYDSGF
jgi:hypothetical protein